MRCRRHVRHRSTNGRSRPRTACNCTYRKLSRAPPSAAQMDDNGAAVQQQTTAAGDDVEVIRERYPDGKIKIERQVTLDADGNYVNHGAVEALFAQRNDRRRRAVRHGQARRQLDPLARQERLDGLQPVPVQQLQAAVCLAGEFHRRRDGRRMARRRRRQQQDHASFAHRRANATACDHLPAQRQDLPPGELRSRRAGRRRARSRQQDRRAEADRHLRRRPPHRHQDGPLQARRGIARAKS